MNPECEGCGPACDGCAPCAACRGAYLTDLPASANDGQDGFGAVGLDADEFAAWCDAQRDAAIEHQLAAEERPLPHRGAA